MNNSITVLQACMLIVTSIGILDHVIIIPILLRTAGRDAWISVLLSGGILFLLIPLIYYIIKGIYPQHLYDWLSIRLGKFIATFIILWIVLEMLMMSAMTLRDVSYWAKVSYMPKTPILVIVLFFCIVSYYSSLSGIRSIAITNGILLPFVVLLGFFVMIANFANKDYALLTPMLEKGFPTVIKGMEYAGSGFSGFFLFILMQHHLKRKIGLLPFFITGFILINLTLSPLTAAIAEFGPIGASRLRFPAYEEWRLVTFGHFLEHVDFLSIYQWLVGSFIRISLAMFLIPEMFNIQSQPKRIGLLLSIYTLLIGISLIPISDMKFMELLRSIYLPFTLIFSLVLVILLGLLVFISRRKEVSD